MIVRIANRVCAIPFPFIASHLIQLASSGLISRFSFALHLIVSFTFKYSVIILSSFVLKPWKCMILYFQLYCFQNIYSRPYIYSRPSGIRCSKIHRICIEDKIEIMLACYLSSLTRIESVRCLKLHRFLSPWMFLMNVDVDGA